MMKEAVVPMFWMALIVVAGAAWAGEAPKKQNKEEKIALDQVPKVVKEAAEAAVKGIVLTEAKKETRGDAVTYDLEGKVGDKEYEIEISAEGKVLEISEEIALNQLPDAVKKAAQGAVKDIVLTEAKKETKGDVVVYEVEGKVGDKDYEIEISAEGKVLKVEQEDDDDDKDGDDEDD